MVSASLFIGQDFYAGAEFDPERNYRYALWRRWSRDSSMLIFIMLNPSTADEETLDPTVRKCCEWARSWGHGGLYVLNAFALRSTNPEALYEHPEPVGSYNDDAIRLTLEEHQDARIVVGWGRHAVELKRQDRMVELLAGRELYAMAVNSDGSPTHPLYLAKATEPQLWKRAA